MQLRAGYLHDVTAVGKVFKYMTVYQLQLGVEFVGLEYLLAVILKAHETANKQHGVSQKPQEQPLRVGYLIP